MIILGGGIGGLSAAHYLLKHQHSNIKIIEASERVGGWIKTIRDQKSGLIFEKGPRTIRVNGHLGFNTLSLIDDIGISSKVRPILSSYEPLKKRFIVVNYNLCAFPSSIFSIFSKTPPFSKPLIYSIYRDFITPKKSTADESVYNFVERRFGKEIADYFVSPLLCGICAGDAKEISVHFLFPGLFKYEQQYGSVVSGYLRSLFQKNRKSKIANEGLSAKAEKEKWNVFGLEGGLYELPDALRKNVVSRGVQIMLNSQITDMKFKKDAVIINVGNNQLKSEHVISSLPARNLAPLLKQDHPNLAKMLESIPYVTVCVVNLAYKRNVLKHTAFGFLIPPNENLPILGVIFDTCTFSQGEWTVLTVMLGGKWFDKYFPTDMKEDEILKLVEKYLKLILEINSPPDVYDISIQKNCIPQYVIGHYENLNNIFSYIKSKKLPISLVGSSYTGVGINDVIFSSKRAVEELKK